MRLYAGKDKNEMHVPLKQFESALKKGLGRAMILLRDHRDDPAFADALIHACKVDLIYDKQCEDERTKYLYQLICSAEKLDFYRTELLKFLFDGNQTIDPNGRVQIFGILCLMAQKDPLFDRSILRDFLDHTDPQTIGINCIDCYVELEGIDGLLLVVRQFYGLLEENIIEGGWLWRSLLQAFETNNGVETSNAVLSNARMNCAELDRLLASPAVDYDVGPKTPVPETDYETVKANFDPKRGFPRAWISTASDADLTIAAKDLLIERDEHTIWRYLQIFRSRDFPLPPKTIFHFTDSPNVRIERAAVAALSRLHHPDVRELALQTISRRTKPDAAIELLSSNFQDGDLKAVQSMIQTLDMREDDWHSIGLALFRLLDRTAVPDNEATDLLVQVYEENPCSMCRGGVVDKLAALGTVPAWMIEEGKFDASSEVVEVLQGLTR